MVELLYPSFERLVPTIVDIIMPHLGGKVHKDLNQGLLVLSRMVAFAWEKQICPKLVYPALSKNQDVVSDDSSWKALK